MKHLKIILLLAICFAMPLQASNPIPKDGVYILEPAEGATVSSPFKVRFGVIGMRVEPAGPVKEKSGHHHILIDRVVAKGEVIPVSPTAIHYGKGDIETTLTLKPGRYKLTLQFADGLHRSYGPDWAHTIEVTVK